MKKIFVFLSFLCVIEINAQNKQYNAGVVAFYNLENIFDTINDPDKNDDDFTPNGSNRYTADVYKDKLSKLSHVLSLIGTDVSPDGFALVGVAEVENRKVLEDLVSQPELKERNLRIVHYEGPDARSIDCGLIYHPKYFKVKHSESLFVKLEGDAGKPYYTRDILWVSGLLGGEMIHVFVNHWPSRRGGEDASAPSRAAAARVCKQVIDSLMGIDINTKVILMGDLNDDPVSPSVVDVLGAQGERSKVARGQLYNPWMDYYSKGIGTLAYNDTWNLFDQILVSESFLNKSQEGFFFKSAHIFTRNFMVTPGGRYRGYPKRTYRGSIYIGGYSDHFPTYCVFLREIKTK